MLEACPEFIEGIGYRLAEKFMKQKFLARFLSFHSDNPKSAIQNPKWMTVVVLAVAFALCGAAAHAQQAGKVPRIGYLEPGTASGNTVLLDGFRQELRGRISPLSTGLPSKRMSGYLSLPRSWSALRLT
jgi:hypothetical protein